MMEPSEANTELKRIESKRGSGSFHVCSNYDVELGHKIAQILLVGLATSCVDNTTGALFKNPMSVAVEIRKEMVDYLRQQSETFVVESVVQEDNSDDVEPSEIVSVMIDDFVESKRNILSRVSGWMLSENREDRVDDFVQDMGRRGFWPTDQREPVAEILIKNVDFKTQFHCGMKFDVEEELQVHKKGCRFRILNCENEGCRLFFCALYAKKHDDECPFKLLGCEQGCEEKIWRREMDRHCVTVCPMKIVKCPFYKVGCETSIPRHATEQHCADSLNSHLLFVLQVIHRQEESVDDLKQRVQLLEKSLSISQRSEALDIRSLTLAIKEQEAKMKALQKDITKAGEKSAQAANVSSQVAQLNKQVQNLQKNIASQSKS